jgi:hypothetical protein
MKKAELKHLKESCQTSPKCMITCLSIPADDALQSTLSFFVKESFTILLFYFSASKIASNIIIYYIVSNPNLADGG